MAVDTEPDVMADLLAALLRLEARLDEWEPLVRAYLEGLGGKAAAWNIRRKARRDER